MKNFRARKLQDGFLFTMIRSDHFENNYINKLSLEMYIDLLQLEIIDRRQIPYHGFQEVYAEIETIKSLL